MKQLVKILLLIGLVVVTAGAVMAEPHLFVPLHWTMGTVLAPADSPDLTLNGRTVRLYKLGNPDVYLTAVVGAGTVAGNYLIYTYNDRDLEINYTDNYSVAVVRGVDNYGANPVAFQFIQGAGYQVVPALTLALGAGPIGTGGTGTLQGIVRNSDGGGIVGASVSINTGTNIYAVISGDDGGYTIPDIPSGNYSAICGAAGYYSSSQPVIIVADTTTTKDFSLTAITIIPGTGTVSGTVSEAGDGPLPGATVSVSNSTGITYATTALIDGRYTVYNLPVSAGGIGYTVFCGANGYYPSSQGVSLSDAAPNAIADFSLEKITILPDTGQVSGKVTKSSDGSAVSGATISVNTGTEILATISLIDGGYTVYNIPYGSYVVYAGALGYESSSSPASLTSGAPNAIVNFALTGISINDNLGKMYGMVTKAAGGALVGATISINTETEIFATTSLIDGSYNLVNITPGNYTAVCGALGYVSDTKLVDLTGTDWVNVNFSLAAIEITPGTGRVFGLVTRASDASAVQGASLTIGALSTTSLFGGEYMIFNITYGNYTVNCVAAGYASANAPANLVNETPVMVNFSLTLGGEPPVPEGTVPLTIARNGPNIELNWNTTAYPAIDIYYLNGDGTGQFSNTTGWTLLAPDITVSPYSDNGQVGTGNDERYYKALVANIDPDVSPVDGDPSYIASAWAVGKINYAFGGGNTFFSVPLRLIGNMDRIMGNQNFGDGAGYVAGSRIYKQTGDRTGFNTTDFLGVGWTNTLGIDPDKGYYYYNTGSEITITLVGNVPLSAIPETMSGGNTLFSVQFPARYAFTVFGAGTAAGDRVLIYNRLALPTPGFDTVNQSQFGVTGVRLSGMVGYYYYRDPLAAPLVWTPSLP